MHNACVREGHTPPDNFGRCLRCHAKVHSCSENGHVWVEADGSLYVRHRGRTRGDVDVACKFCDARAQLEAHAEYTRGKGSTPVGKQIPPQFLAVMERALDAAPPSSAPANDTP